MNRYSTILLSCLSGVLLCLAWPPLHYFTFVVFFAWVPFLYATHKTKTLLFFALCALCMFLVWNIGTTWWIVKSTWVGGILAMVANSLLMTFVLCLYYIIRKESNFVIECLSLIILWMSFEFIHLHWQLSWPWLNLGNVFADRINWIEWYRYTGVGGGTLWILITNCIIYWIVIPKKKGHLLLQLLFSITLLLIVWMVPFFFSHIIAKATNKHHDQYAQYSTLWQSFNDITTIDKKILQCFKEEKEAIKNNYFIDTNIHYWQQRMYLFFNKADTTPFTPLFLFKLTIALYEQHKEMELNMRERHSIRNEASFLDSCADFIKNCIPKSNILVLENYPSRNIDLKLINLLSERYRIIKTLISLKLRLNDSVTNESYENFEMSIRIADTIFGKSIGLSPHWVLDVYYNGLIAQETERIWEEYTGNIIIVQPNENPYHKFDTTNTENEINQLISLTKQKIDSNTILVVWPETALPIPILEDSDMNTLKNNYDAILNFVHQYPYTFIISGIETYKLYNTNPNNGSARKLNDNCYIDNYNSAIGIQDNYILQYHNKSKLVPGVETLPPILKFLEPFFSIFGGATSSYGISTNPSVVFHRKNSSLAFFAPIICYESIYGDYVASFVSKGAEGIVIMTNDGWWGNTPGYKQHLAYARLRAIETNKWVIRAANTGISCFISPSGDIIQPSQWDKHTILKYTIPYYPDFTQWTFYVKYGDYLYHLSFLLSLLIIFICLMSWLKQKIEKIIYNYNKKK